jgi:SAM-dependent methyltransferase
LEAAADQGRELICDLSETMSAARRIIELSDRAVFVRLNGRLAQFKRSPTREYWEKHWGFLTDKEVAYVLRRSTSMVSLGSFFRRHIPPGATVLEAGCGVGLWVRRLRENGFNAIGLDYARETIGRSKRIARDLPFVAGDLRSLPFSNGTLDTHLSFGVIEHYVDGPYALLKEAQRVLRSGGKLLASVPQVNITRKRIEGYSPDEAESLGYRFHQYYYEPEELHELMSNLGIEPIKDSHCYSAYHGLRESFPFLQKLEERFPRISRVSLVLDYIPALTERYGHMMFIAGEKR